MTLDISQGDLLVTDPGKANETVYYIRAVEDWTKASFNTAGFQRLADVDCSIKRGVATSGKTAAPTNYLTGKKCLALMPVDAQLAARSSLSGLSESMQTMIADSSGFVLLIVSKTLRSS